jgi:pyridoxal phosphate enzyme (YggS family)
VSITDKLHSVRNRIDVAEQKYGRAPGSVSLLAVSKSQPIGAIREALTAGQLDFGENYLREALQKSRELHKEGLQWHYIGPVQSNKTRQLADTMDWVHSVDREKIAQRLSDARKTHATPLNVCIQVNISGEMSKSGISPGEVETLASQINRMPGLKLRGLMVIPAISEDFDIQRQAFSKTRHIYEQLLDNGYELDTLSMGMSMDMEAAIAEGSTMVRIGTAIFGPRMA